MNYESFLVVTKRFIGNVVKTNNFLKRAFRRARIILINIAKTKKNGEKQEISTPKNGGLDDPNEPKRNFRSSY